MIDQTGRPVEERIAEERESSNAQIRTLLNEQRRTIIAEYGEKVLHHELLAAQAEQIRRILQEELLRQQQDFREVHQQDLFKMKELQKFQNSTFDEFTQQKFIGGSEDNYGIIWKTSRTTEWSKLHEWFQGFSGCLSRFAVEIHTLPVHPGLFPRHPPFEGLLKPAFLSQRQTEEPPNIRDTSGISGNGFCTSTDFFISSVSSGIKFYLEENYWRTNSHVYSGEKWKTRTRPRSGMPVWTVSQRFSHLQWRRLFKELWGRPTTDCRFRIFILTSSLHQQPLLAGKIRFKTEVCTCSQFPTEAMQWIKEVELVDSVDELRSSSSTRGISMPNFEVLDARIASALNKIIHNSHSKRKISLEEQKAQKEDRFLRGRQIAYLIYDYFRVTGSHDSVENYTDLFTIVLRNDDIQEFDSKWDENIIVYDENPAWWHLGRIVQIKNTRVWETRRPLLELYDLETHQKKLGPDYHRLKAMVKRSIEQEIRN